MTSLTTYEKVALWNERCGKVPPKVGTDEYWEALDNQAQRIEEELNELKQAIEERDFTETFDALLDLDVVVSGGAYLSGGDYHGGINEVLKNNDRKFTSLWETIDVVYYHYKTMGIETKIYKVKNNDLFDVEAFYSVHRVSDDKVMKFPGHPPVDLSPFIPKVGEDG